MTIKQKVDEPEIFVPAEILPTTGGESSSETEVVQATPVSSGYPTETTTTTPQYNVQSSNPPGQCEDGGQWGEISYNGDTTKILGCLGCLFIGPIGLIACCLNFDKKDVYCVRGKIYDAAGVFLGSANDYNFIPGRRLSKSLTPSSRGLFGSRPIPTARGGLFGAAAPSASAPTVFASHSATSNSGGLFETACSSASGGILFGAAPATAPAGGLFGAPAPAPSGGGF